MNFLVKKHLVFGITAVILIGGSIAKAWDKPEFSPEFVSSLKNCKPYTYTTPTVEIFGMKVSATKKILGVKNSYCYYSETTGPTDARTTINCKFSKEQINRLVDAMQNNSNSGKPMSIEYGSQTRVSGGDNASRIWTEYFNNPAVCK